MKVLMSRPISSDPSSLEIPRSWISIFPTVAVDTYRYSQIMDVRILASLSIEHLFHLDDQVQLIATVREIYQLSYSSKSIRSLTSWSMHSTKMFILHFLSRMSNA